MTFLNFQKCIEKSLLVFKYLFFCLLTVFVISCASSNKLKSKRTFLSVKEFGAHGNGIKDDRKSIQKAFNYADTIYFPPGNYLLSSKSRSSSILYIDERSKTTTLVFDSLAMLIVSKDLPKDYYKPAVLELRAKYGDIDSFSIYGLNINGNFKKNKLGILGIAAIEESRKSIKKLNLNDIEIFDVGHSGIHTQATRNYFTNIRTTNCGVHGIGIINPKNPHRSTHFYLDNFMSIGDRGYSIDFSGKKYKTNQRKLSHGEKYYGDVKNVISVNSASGIKTAGNWDLSMQNVKIIDSKNNGFFLNHDAAESQILLKNISIIGAKNNGMSLLRKGNLIGNNLKISGCKVGIKIGDCNVNIDSLLIDGKNQNAAGIRMGSSNVKIKNFEIRNNNIKDKYPIWVSGSKVILENGKIEGNDSEFGLIIHEKARDVVLDNLKISGNNLKGGILNIQKQGTTILKNTDLSNIKNSGLIDSNNRIKIDQSSKINSKNTKAHH